VSTLFWCKGNTKAQSAIKSKSKSKSTVKIVWNSALLGLYNNVEVPTVELDQM